MDYLGIFYGVLGYLGKALLVLGAFHFGKNVGAEMVKWKGLLTVLGTIAILSLMMWSSYGTHTEDADPLRGGGSTVVDFEPTSQERNEYGWTIFFALTIPALYGVYRARQQELVRETPKNPT